MLNITGYDCSSSRGYTYCDCELDVTTKATGDKVFGITLNAEFDWDNELYCDGYGTDCSYTGGTPACQGICWLLERSNNATSFQRVSTTSQAGYIGYGLGFMITGVICMGCAMSACVDCCRRKE